MKNKERYDLRNFSVASCNGIVKLFDGEGLFFKEFKGYSSFIGWLEEECKEPIKLTEDEFIILKNVSQMYPWILRNKNSGLFIYKNKPNKFECSWLATGEHRSFSMFEHIFKFIKWEDEEPYNIQELLENYKKGEQ